MKTYWDYTEKERSEMERDFVSTLLDAELMTKGVLKVEPPILRPVPNAPVLEQETWYCVGDNLFASAEQASSFLELKPHKERYNYEVGYDHKYAEPLEGEIKTVKIFSRQGILSASKILSEIKTAKEANDKAERAFKEASKEVDKVLNGVWEDWHACQAIARNKQKVLNTFNDYKKTAGGDERIAFGFLRKVFSQESIKEAFDWLAVEMPNIPEEASQA